MVLPQLPRLAGVGWLLLPVLAVGCTTQSIYQDKAGKFSIELPHGWSMTETQALKFLVLAGPESHGFIPNLDFVADESTAAFEEYVGRACTRLAESLRDFRELERAEFVTDQAYEGLVVRIRSQHRRRVIHQSIYFFQRSDESKFIVTATAVQQQAEELRPVFDGAVRTLRFDEE